MRHIRGLAMAKAATRVTATCCSGSWAGRMVGVRRDRSPAWALVFRVCRRVLGHEAGWRGRVSGNLPGPGAVRRPTVRDGGTLVSWPYGWQIGWHAKQNERQGGDGPTRHAARDPAAADPASQATWTAGSHCPRDEIQRLPERLRAPFILCCQDGRSRARWRLSSSG